MTISFELTAEDRFDTILTQTQGFREGLRKLASVGALMAAGLTWALLTEFPGAFRLGIALGIGFLMLRHLPTLPEQWLEKRRAQLAELPETVLESVSVSLEDAGLRVVRATDELLLRWAVVGAAVDGTTTFWISSEPKQVLDLVAREHILIPKRAFSTDEDRIAFLAEIDARRAGAVENSI